MVVKATMYLLDPESQVVLDEGALVDELPLTIVFPLEAIQKGCNLVGLTEQQGYPKWERHNLCQFIV